MGTANCSFFFPDFDSVRLDWSERCFIDDALLQVLHRAGVMSLTCDYAYLKICARL